VRLLLLTAGVLAAAQVYADGPPGSIVIRPGGSGAAPTRAEDLYPDRPGFIVIRPKASGALPRPRPLEESGSPVIRIIRGPGGKPAQPEPPTPAAPATPAVPAAQAPAPDEKKDGRIVLETWDATFLKGHPVGHFHVVVREYERDGRKLLYATKKQKMTVSRFGQAVEQWGEDSTMEAPDGQVYTTRMSQGIGNNQMLALSGKVSGKVLSVTIEGAGGGTQDVPWPDGVIGIAKEATLLKDRKPKVGESFDYLSYEGRLNRVVKFTATAKGFEEVQLYEGRKPTRVLRVELAMEPIKTPGGGEFRLPPSTLWADAETYEPLKMESDMPTLGGKLIVMRTTKEVALRKPVKLVELFDVQSIRLDREVANVHDQAGVTYRVKLTGDLPPDKVFAQDARQTVGDVDPEAKTFELRVTAVREPARVADPAAKVGEEFLAPSFFVDWDNDAVRGHRERLAEGPRGRDVGESQHAIDRVQPGDGDVRQRGEVALRRLHRVCDAGRGHVPGAGGAVADGAGAGVRGGSRRQAVPGVPHVVRGVRGRPVAGTGRDARPRVGRPRSREDHRRLLARGEVVRAAAAGADGARLGAEGRGAQGHPGQAVTPWDRGRPGRLTFTRRRPFTHTGRQLTAVARATGTAAVPEVDPEPSGPVASPCDRGSSEPQPERPGRHPGYSLQPDRLTHPVFPLTRVRRVCMNFLCPIASARMSVYTRSG